MSEIRLKKWRLEQGEVGVHVRPTGELMGVNSHEKESRHGRLKYEPNAFGICVKAYTDRDRDRRVEDEEEDHDIPFPLP